jgi:hypothetical protein
MKFESLERDFPVISSEIISPPFQQNTQSVSTPGRISRHHKKQGQQADPTQIDNDLSYSSDEEDEEFSEKVIFDSSDDSSGEDVSEMPLCSRSVDGTHRSQRITFSEEPPQIRTYERPLSHEKTCMYYSSEEMHTIQSDYHLERYFRKKMYARGGEQDISIAARNSY